MFVGIICEFAMVPGMYILCVPLGRRGSLFFLRAQMHAFSNTFIKKIKTFIASCYYAPRLLLDWKKLKREIQLCHGAYSETKQYSEIPTCFWFQ